MITATIRVLAPPLQPAAPYTTVTNRCPSLTSLWQRHPPGDAERNPCREELPPISKVTDKCRAKCFPGGHLEDMVDEKREGIMTRYGLVLP